MDSVQCDLCGDQDVGNYVIMDLQIILYPSQGVQGTQAVKTVGCVCRACYEDRIPQELTTAIFPAHRPRFKADW